MRRNPMLCGLSSRLLGLLFLFLLPAVASSQTVGDPFIDTSEWVQSTSPIRDQGRVEGYITETIVRGYRGPNYDRYYGGSNSNSAIEFSSAPKIQPIVYENSPANSSTSLEPPRPTPDPVVQASNNGIGFGNRIDNQVRPATLADMRGFASQASYQQPVSNQPYVNQPYANQPYANQPSANRMAPNQYNAYANSYSQPNRYPQNGWIQTGYAPQPTQPAFTASNYVNTSAYPVRTPYPAQSTSQPPTYSRPVMHTATQGSCCDPVYTQTQFVSPNVNQGAGALKTYPQYGGNPYPNRGFGISQPYVRDTYVPLIPLRSMPYGTYLGQGMIGQPVAYVDGEPVRNFLRYIFP